MLKEQMAIRTITGIISTWEKMKTKLENAIESLKETVSNNKAKQRTEEERARLRIKDLENKNNGLLKEIEKAEAFKLNIERMLK